MKIRWMGPFNHSGFGIESVQMVKALVALGHEVECVIMDNRVSMDDVKGIEHCFVSRPKGWADRTVVHAIPPPLDMKVDVLWQNYEYIPAPDSWRWMVNNANVVLAESEHSKACLESITTKPVGIVPSGIDPTFGDGFKGQRIAGANEFAFLSVLEWVPRKQGYMLIDAFCEAFTPDDHVFLFLKATNGVENARAAIARQLMKHLPMRNNVIFIDQNIADMGQVYPAFDGYVLPSALEGWGITFMEAIACGIKPVCPAVGGNAMFCTAENSYPVKMGEWEPAVLFGNCTLFNPDAQWRVPDKADLIANMQRAVAEKTRLPPETREAFKAKWSWENAAKKLLEAMG
jgi:glycosyltransferase involved in cell wall biosynthesis